MITRYYVEEKKQSCHNDGLRWKYMRNVLFSLMSDSPPK
jgi:hypothetical protein